MIEIRNPLLLALVQFLATFVSAILVITIVFGDPLQQAIELGIVFGIIFAIIGYFTTTSKE